MKNQSIDTNKGLSIQELEERHELSVAVPSDAMEATKDDNNDTEIDRCSGNSNGGN